MSGELNVHTTTGLTVKAIIWGENRTTRWNGSSMVAASSIADAAWATGMIACPEQDTSDGTGSGTYAGDFESSLGAGEYAIEFYAGASPTPGQLAIGIQTVNWGGSSVNMLTAADVADAVWDEAYAGHVDAGSFGILIGAAFEEV